MNSINQALSFSCSGDRLLGIVSMPEEPLATGVLIVVGGPQYRVGSHRQFLLLSRALAQAGYTTMRFDYRGMGDSTGELRDFAATNDDIGAAINAMQAHCPQLKRIVLWGLCDAASASLLYWDSTKDVRVGGLVLLNPWVRSEATLARAHIKHYYGQRLMQADFWRKLFAGKLGLWRAIGGFVNNLKSARLEVKAVANDEVLSFQQRMARGLRAFPGQVLLVLSEADYTAKEFIEAVQADAELQAAIQRSNIQRTDIPGADHTFSSVAWRREVEDITRQWLDTKVQK